MLSNEQKSKLNNDFTIFIPIIEEKNKAIIYCFEDYDDFSDFWFENRSKYNFGYENKTIEDALKECTYITTLDYENRFAKGIKICKNKNIIETII